MNPNDIPDLLVRYKIAVILEKIIRHSRRKIPMLLIYLFTVPPVYALFSLFDSFK